MTLLAAFKNNGIPMLIGDFLVSTSSKIAKPMFMPTAPKYSGSDMFKPINYVKKIYIINNKFAIGFTGKLNPARYIIKKIKDRFSKKVTFSELKSLLFNIRCAYKKDVELTGWICKKRPLCFHWSGKNPNELKIVSDCFIGSGKDHFKSMHNSGDLTKYVNFKRSFDKALFFGLTKVSSILHGEMTTGENLHHMYGLGAELIIWNGVEFSYIKKVSFIFVEAVINENNQINITLIPCVCTYENFESLSLLQIYYEGKMESDLLNLHPTTNTFIMHYESIDNREIKENLRKTEPVSPESNLWFTGVIVKYSDGTSLGKIRMISAKSNSKQKSFVCFKNGLIELNVKMFSDEYSSVIFQMKEKYLDFLNGR
ncbi:hypothetical protein [Marinicella sp. W31]|uniref:hypothetical protein n=1 Tax=Marinicella sp. W31 TaxID=3023713 RepID=UPI003756DCEB